MLAGLIFFAVIFAPIYLRNQKLQSFVAGIPQRVETQTQAGEPPSDDAVRSWVLDKARELGLPVKAGDVQVVRSRDNGRIQRVSAKYFVRVDLPGYTVDLHFYPGAGSR